MSYDLIDDPRYELNGLSVSTASRRPKRGSREDVLQAHWAVYYHGRLLHDHLHTDEVQLVRHWYADNVPANDARWQMLATPGKKPSPSSDHIRKAAGQI